MFVLGDGSDPCDHIIKSHTISPDGAFQAATLDVGCGATTGFTRWAVVAPTSRPFNYRKDEVASITGQEAKLAWENGKLVVSYPAGERANLQPSELLKVELRSY